VPPLLAIGGGAWWWLKRHQIVTVRSAKWMKLVPGLQRTVYQDYLANFAEMLAVQLEQGVSLEESLRVAACAGGDARLVEASRGLIVALRRGALPAVDDLVALRFPPFLRWAIWSEQQPNAQATALRLAANIYRDSACKRFEYLRWVAPVVLGALIGGGVTLLYALAFFKPVTDMLYELTK
jgi:type II secretory pathway component PulF